VQASCSKKNLRWNAQTATEAGDEDGGWRYFSTGAMVEGIIFECAASCDLVVVQYS